VPLEVKTDNPRLFDSKKVRYTDHVLPSTTVNVNYIISALKMFLKALCQKGPDLVPREWMFYGITLQFTLHVNLSRSWPKKNSSLFPNTLSLLSLAQAEYFLFLKVKRELAGLTMSPWTGSRRCGRGSSGL
jgi:hypothetical protein